MGRGFPSPRKTVEGIAQRFAPPTRGESAPHALKPPESGRTKDGGGNRAAIRATNPWGKCPARAQTARIGARVVPRFVRGAFTTGCQGHATGSRVIWETRICHERRTVSGSRAPRARRRVPGKARSGRGWGRSAGVHTGIALHGGAKLPWLFPGGYSRHGAAPNEDGAMGTQGTLRRRRGGSGL